MNFKKEIEEIKINPNSELDEVIEKIFNETYNPNYYYNSNFKNSKAYQELKKKPDEFKIKILFRVVEFVKLLSELNNQKRESEKDSNLRNDTFNIFYKRVYVLKNIIEDMLRSKIIFSEESILSLLEEYSKLNFVSNDSIYSLTFKQIKNVLAKYPDSPSLISFMKQRIENSNLIPIKDAKDRDKIVVFLSETLSGLSSDANSKEEIVTKILWATGDSFGEKINSYLETLDQTTKSNFYKIFALGKKASGGKPNAKFKEETKKILNSVETNSILPGIKFILESYLNFKVEKITETYTYGGKERSYDRYENINAVNSDMLKVFIWAIIPILNIELINLIAKIAEKSYKKIPGKGPANAAIGNACFYALASSNTLEAVNHLSILKLKLKQSSVLKLIDGYIEEIAKESGLSKREMEDMAVPQYGLEEGKSTTILGEYTNEILVKRPGEIETIYKSPEGKILKVLPAKFKTENKEELKRISDLTKEISKSLTANKDRLDRSYIYNRSWKYEDFLKYFHNHGLMSVISRKLIWSFTVHSEKHNLYFFENKWIDFSGKEQQPDSSSVVTLWHPVGEDLEEILAWRNFFMEKEITQPFKQAFREVYIITDAELNTRTYSNRMAAHIIKQHQFNTLAKGRAWSYSLLGAYDDGRDNEIAELVIPEYNLKANFWINELFIQDEFNDSGIWNFVGTDQVRFVDRNGNVLELIHIPAILFSEVMRDVDLFVGVGSVGNDPEWNDRGNMDTPHRNYWQGYSFGDLNETAKIRKQVLEKILPKLKIANHAEIKDKFLIVKGKLRTYKIHIGSSNILMEPNDEYLCIVPDRVKSKTETFFLPFEGDSGLSSVISKAFLLSSDDKITDETILRQIKK